MEALDWLFKQFPSYQIIGAKAYKPTLDNTRNILEFLGNPEKSLRFIHVAGSNGKGSVCSYSASILKEHGLRVGLFTSPHIAHFSERIRVNGVPISDQAIEEFVHRIRTTDFSFSPSFFEITFGMALEHFKKENCDICVIETGLGGRLDATNVITPEISVITSISLEHTNLLGSTLEEIAGEKAGIIKKDVPVVIGAGCASTNLVFKEKSLETNSKLIESTQFPKAFANFFPVSYQRENFATTYTLLKELFSDIDETTILKGIENIHANSGFYGRLQRIDTNPDVIFDVSHNEAGIKATFESIIDQVDGDLHVIYGASNDKNLDAIKNIFPTKIHFYATEFNNERSMTAAGLQNIFSEIPFKSASYFKDAQLAMKAARSNASRSDTIIVIGSFFLLSDFF